MTTIPQRVLDLNTWEGFYELYESMKSYYDTYERAYVATEAEYIKHYGKSKYSSYISFRAVTYKNLNT